jgi:hypothetical protein
MPLLADDDVVVDVNPERLRGVQDLFGHLDTGAGGGGIALGVVMHEHDGRCRQFERPLHHLPHIDRGVVDGASLLHLVGDHLVALVEEQDAENGQAPDIIGPRPTFEKRSKF